jgi:hypothetical protein
LNDVLLTKAAVASWAEMTRRLAPLTAQIVASGATIPDEECEELEGGVLRIFVKISEDMEMSMEVPPGQWAYRPGVKN